MKQGSSPELPSQKVPNEDILEVKGILNYFQHIDPEVLDKRVCMGEFFVWKEIAENFV